MKVVHVTTYLFGGAFTGLKRLHAALLKKGVDSHILYLHGNDKGQVINSRAYDGPVSKRKSYPSRFSRTLSKLPWPKNKSSEYIQSILPYKKSFEELSFPVTGYDILQSKILKDADIINLHWVSQFLDYSTFFQRVEKPVVWTLRDMNPFLGCLHYNTDYEKKLNIDVREIDGYFQKMKVNYVNEGNDLQINLVGISEWIKNESLKRRVFSSYPHHRINNCINVDGSVKHVEKKMARRILGLPEDFKIFCFTSTVMDNYRKGFDVVKDVFSSITENRKVLVLTFGSLTLSTSFSPGILHLGLVQEHDLSLIYSACDALLFPSREEAFGNVMLEAMSCGLPVISFPSGGPVDVIKNGFNGILSDHVSTDSFREAVLRYMETEDSFFCSNIIDYTKENFSPEKAAMEYMSLYETILER